MSEAMFICDGCGKVYAETCPTCPDRGNGRGFTVGQIKQALRDSQTVGDVNHTAKHFGRHVAILEREGGDARAMAIQIKNLASYQRLLLWEGRA